MKHSRIKIRDDKGQFVSALDKANRSLRKRIKDLKKEGQEISHSMIYTQAKMALLDAGFASDLSDVSVGNHIDEFNGIVNFMAWCREYPVIFMISVDKED